MKTSHKLLISASCAAELMGSHCIKHQLDNIATGQIRAINPMADVLIHGVGMFQSQYQLMKALQRERYGLMVVAGIAGAYSTSIRLADTYMVCSNAFADCATENPDGTMAPVVGSRFLPGNTPPFTNGRIESRASQELGLMLGLKCARANTVSRISTRKESISEILRLHPAELETMESAALAYTCAMEGVEYAEIRSVSNHTLPKSEQKWMFAESTASLGKIIDKMLDNNCKMLEEYLEQRAKNHILAP